jgi:glycosyltransferase involved in cell wall biosynthesis
MTSDTTFAAIITTVNRPEMLMHCLNSLMLQTRKIDEIIIVDDSAEGQEILLHPDICGITKVVHTKGLGRSLARNAGLAVTGTKFVSFLDDDDMWCSDRLAAVVQFLESNPDCKAAHHNVYYFSETHELTNPYGGHIDFCATDFDSCEESKKVHKSKNDFSYLNITGNSFTRLMLDNTGCIPGAVISSEIAKAVGGFCPFLASAEDQFFFLIVATYTEWEHLDKDLAYVRIHPTQSSHSSGTLTAIVTSMVLLIWGGGMDRYLVNRIDSKVMRRFWNKVKILLKASIIDSNATGLRKLSNILLLLVVVLGVMRLRSR